jgi:hypothetical protein
MDELKQEPGIEVPMEDEGDTGSSLLEPDAMPAPFIRDPDEPGDLRSYGFSLEPLLQTQEKGSPPGSSNPPTGCKVSHPEMLGDGNCDGGDYNTELCNYDGGDCCAADCRNAMHECGMSGYQCAGQRQGVRILSEFKCAKSKAKEFTDYYETLRDQLTVGSAMVSQSQCSHLTQEEHNNVAQAFNLGVELGYYAKTQSAAAQKGGPELYIQCKLFETEVGGDWFGTLITHELGHSAGYSHPKFKKQTFYSECEDIGSDYCQGHCMEWTRACENHGVFGSESCGFAGFGCKTMCVHSDYCFSLPERLTECFGYQKVHSRAESLTKRTGAIVESVFGFNPFSWFGGSWKPSLWLSFCLTWLIFTNS